MTALKPTAAVPARREDAGSIDLDRHGVHFLDAPYNAGMWTAGRFDSPHQKALMSATHAL